MTSASHRGTEGHTLRDGCPYPAGSGRVGLELAGQVDLGGLSASAAQTVRGSVFAGVDMAQQNGSGALLDSVRAAFTHGMGVALIASAGIAVAGTLFALIFLPMRGVAAKPPAQPAAEADHVAVG